MLKSEYGVKYPFPHSVVHIIDNSMYVGELPVVVANDPSLYATIVVCGAPMGEDNKMITITRSDVANVAFGLGNLEASTIERYGQTITYVNSLISQNVPVKFMRVTPDDAAYGAAIIVVQWRIDPDDDKIHVRFKNAEWPASISRSRFKNTSRINDALVTALSNDSVYEDGYTWKQRVLINAISAGRGSVYNNMSFAVNMSSQSKKPANVKYVFSTIDARTSRVVERFDASLVNINNQGRTDFIPTLNTVVSRRVKGSSVIVPYLNERVVTELYNTYMTHLQNQIASGFGGEYAERVAASVNVNTFDVIYGNYIYNGTDSAVKLPFYQVDSINTDIIKLDRDHIIDSGIVDTVDYGLSMFEDEVIGMTTGIINPNDTVHVGDLYLTPQSSGSPKITVIASVNQYTGSITSVTIPKLFPISVSNGTANVKYDMPSAEIKYLMSGLISEFKGNKSVRLRSTQLSNAYPELANQVNMKLIEAGSIIAGATDTTFEVYYVSKISQSGITLYKYTNDNIYFALDRNSHQNLIKGTGNVLAWEYDLAGKDMDIVSQLPGGDVSYRDYVYAFPGYTVITHGNADNAAVYVNGYNIEVKTENDQTTATGRILVSDAALKVGTVPQSVAINNDTVGEKYDVRSFETSAVDTFLIKGFDLKDATGTSNVKYEVGDYVSAIIDSSDEPKSGQVDITIKDNEDGTPEFYKVGETGKLTSFDLTKVYHDVTDGTNGTYYIATSETASIDSLNVVTTFPREYKDADGKIVTENLVLNQHLVLNVTGVDENGNITSYTVKRSGTIKNDESTPATDGAEAIPSLFEKAVAGKPFILKKITYVEDTATDDTAYATVSPNSVKVLTTNASPYAIKRYIVSGSLGSLYRIAVDATDIPANYYNESDYGIVLNSENGGVRVTGGSTGFFDDPNMNSIEFKWRYSELLVRAFKGELDKTIMSPNRVPAKYLFDGAWNTIVGANIVPELTYTSEELINASTIFTEEEKEAILFDKSLLYGIGQVSADIDVKAAMYALMDYRVFQGIPEDFRPMGQGSGLSLHLDSGVTDDNTLQLVANSFTKRFSSYNASWDIGGYTDTETGITYTYTKWIVDHLFDHMAKYTVNKPFANGYAIIPNDRYTSYFPEIDAVDWDKRAAAYVSGGNSWIVDPNNNIRRQSQKTLYRVDETSDLIQESNARTLSQLVYLLQNKINTYLLEYADDETLQTMTNDCNMMFSNWVGSRVDALSIRFERDINPEDGGDLVVCYCDVTFKGLVLRVPVIVNVQRRTS